MFIFELLCENRFSLLLKNIERMETNEFQKAEEKRLEDFFLGMLELNSTSFECVRTLGIRLAFENENLPIGRVQTNLEQVTGIEPAYSAWKAEVLPLNYTCKWRTIRDSNSWSPP